MKNWNSCDSLLELVEALAEYEGWISSEEELSERFDEEIAEDVIANYGVDDEPAMSETFNNWTDALCKDGTIHPEQYDKYCYVGKYS